MKRNGIARAGYLARARGLSCAALTSFAALASCAALGCDDMARFSTGPHEAYCGSITLAGAFRTGFTPRVQMRLKLDAMLIDGPGSPGSLSTFEAADGDQPERRMLEEAELRRIPPMDHDPLSRLSFGEGRERNAIYAVSPADPEAESVLAILSLRSDEQVEVRLLRGGSAESAPSEGRQPLFGIFTLSREKGECGF
jgi:hypothetical protein